MGRIIRKPKRPSGDCRFNNRIYIGGPGPWDFGEPCSFTRRMNIYYIDPPVVTEYINIPDYPVIARDPGHYDEADQYSDRTFYIHFVNEGDVTVGFTSVQLTGDTQYYTLSSVSSSTIEPGDYTELVLIANYPDPFVSHTEATVEFYDHNRKIRWIQFVMDFQEHVSFSMTYSEPGWESPAAITCGETIARDTDVVYIATFELTNDGAADIVFGTIIPQTGSESYIDLTQPDLTTLPVGQTTSFTVSATPPPSVDTDLAITIPYNDTLSCTISFDLNRTT